MSIEAMKIALQGFEAILSARARGFGIDYVEGYATTAIRDLRQAIGQAEKQVTSLQCAHCQETIESLNDRVMYLMGQAEKQEPVADERRSVMLDARNEAMQWALKGRIPECGAFAGIAQNLDWLCDQYGIKENT